MRIYGLMFSWYTLTGEMTYDSQLLIDADQIRIFDPVPQLSHAEIEHLKCERYPRRCAYPVIADSNKERRDGGRKEAVDEINRNDRLNPHLKIIMIPTAE